MLPSFRPHNIFHFPQLNDQYPWGPPPANNPWTRTIARPETGCPIHPLQPVAEALRLTVPLNEFNKYMLQAIRMTIKVYTRRGLILAASLERILTVHFFGPGIPGILRRPTTDWVTIPEATRIQHVKELVSSHPDVFKISYRNNPLCVIGLQQMVNTDNIPLELMTLSQRMFSKARLSISISKAELMLKVGLHTWDVMRARDIEARQEGTPCCWYKSVTIANEVRKRVGAEGFKLVKATYGAFLAFLGHFPNIFEVYRYAKADVIRLRPEGADDANFRTLFQELYDSCEGNFRHRFSVNPGQPTRSLHISNIPDALNADEFAKYFNDYHPTSTRLCIQHNKRYGFVNFYTLEEAMAAKASLESETIWTHSIEYARQHSDTAPHRFIR